MKNFWCVVCHFRPSLQTVFLLAFRSLIPVVLDSTTPHWFRPFPQCPRSKLLDVADGPCIQGNGAVANNSTATTRAQPVFTPHKVSSSADDGLGTVGESHRNLPRADVGRVEHGLAMNCADCQAGISGIHFTVQDPS